jgi:hypothetical protein
VTPLPARHGYDARWWARALPERAAGEPYVRAVRGPMPSLCLVAPLLVIYELGLYGLERSGIAASRNGVDAWIRHAMGAIGLNQPWLPPLLLIAALLVWRLADEGKPRVRAIHLLGMTLEGLAFGFALLALSRVIDIAVVHLEGGPPALATEGGMAALAGPIGYIGAGIYEEAVFRLALIPALIYGIRLLLVPRLMAGVLAIFVSSLAFSMAHHAGAPGEAFTWYAFVFRWFAGIYFAWIFVNRGFGIAVAAHVAYDCFVGAIRPFE